MNDEPIKHQALKAASAWGGWIGTALVPKNWAEAAAMLAAIYSLCLITEWFWKRIGKPFAQRRGWIEGRPRDFMDSTGSAPL